MDYRLAKLTMLITSWPRIWIWPSWWPKNQYCSADPDNTRYRCCRGDHQLSIKWSSPTKGFEKGWNQFDAHAVLFVLPGVSLRSWSFLPLVSTTVSNVVITMDSTWILQWLSRQYDQWELLSILHLNICLFVQRITVCFVFRWVSPYLYSPLIWHSEVDYFCFIRSAGTQLSLCGSQKRWIAFRSYKSWSMAETMLLLSPTFNWISWLFRSTAQRYYGSYWWTGSSVINSGNSRSISCGVIGASRWL
jgi:hypothetical protein